MPCVMVTVLHPTQIRVAVAPLGISFAFVAFLFCLLLVA